MASQFHAVIAPVLVEDRLRRAHDRRQAGGLNAGLTTTVSKRRGRCVLVAVAMLFVAAWLMTAPAPAHAGDLRIAPKIQGAGTVSRGDVDSCTSHDQDERRTMDCPQHVVSGWAT